MTAAAAAQRYFDAWNRHEAGPLLAAFAPTGSYADPGTPQPLRGWDIVNYANGLFATFPDLSFEVASLDAGAEGRASAQWVMRGTNTGPLGTAPPTGARVELAGSSFFTIADDLVSEVRSYFDRQTMPEQLGMQVIIQPQIVGSMLLGTSVHMTPSRIDPPGAVTLSWVEARTPAEAVEVTTVTGTEVIQELGALPGFLSAVLARAGNRMFTVAAWDDAASATAVVEGEGPGEKTRGLLTGARAGSAGHTAVWVPGEARSTWVRCAACGRASDPEAAEGRCECGAELTARPLW
jgi:steroid delta-isomerase-like uncharacterized protein